MKVLGLTYNYKENCQEGFPGIFLMADSSILKDGKPFFIPDFSSDFEATTALAYRVCRLGKNISKKFAHRYYDAVTLGLNLTAQDIKEKLLAAGQPTDFATSFDGAAIMGDFMPIEQYNGEINYSLQVNDQEICTNTSANMIYDIDSIIEYISRFYTLKIGDIIFTGSGSKSFKIDFNQEFKGYLNGNKILNFKTK